MGSSASTRMSFGRVARRRPQARGELVRILGVVPYYAPEGGGLERYAHEMLRRLAARGNDVTALAFTKEGLGDEVRGGVRVRRRRAPVRAGNAPIDPLFALAVRRHLLEHRPHVVLAHTPVPFPAEAAFLASRTTRTPFVTTYHAGRLHGSTPVLDAMAALDRASLERFMLAGSGRLVAVSPYVRDHALARHRDRVSIVPPGVDHQRFTPNGREREREVLFVGPLDSGYRWKGVDVLLDAFETVRASLPAARLTLVGEGDRYDELRDRAAATDGAVRLVGRVSEDALVRAYQRAAVTVLPSTSDAESFGMVLAEANACGCPVVGSDIGGIPSFVRHGDNGLLARAGDADDLAERILTVLTDDGLARRLGERGRARVVHEHDWDRLALATERVAVEAALDGSL